MESAPGSAPTEIPIALRGKRVMNRLFGLTADLRAAGTEPAAVDLSADDEQRIFESVGATFGPSGEQAARRGRDAWRHFLTEWFAHTVKLALSFDAVETRVR